MVCLQLLSRTNVDFPAAEIVFLASFHYNKNVHFSFFKDFFPI